MPSLSIIIPTRDRETIFSKTLAGILEATAGMDAEIIIVNDSPRPLSPSLTAQLQTSNCILIQTGGKGVATARNMGVARAASDTILFVDDDVLVTKEAINYLLEELKKQPKQIINLNWTYPPGLVSKLKNNYFGEFIVSNGLNSLKGYRNGLSWNDEKVFDAEAIANYLVMMPRNVFTESGGYNNVFPFAGGEDTELSFRLAKKGVQFKINPTLTVYHNEEDRIDLDNWLQRKLRSGMTAKAFVHIGYNQYALSYSFLRRVAYSLIYWLSPLFIFIIKRFPYSKALQPLFSRLIHVILASYIYHGYSGYNPKAHP